MESKVTLVVEEVVNSVLVLIWLVLRAISFSERTKRWIFIIWY